MQRDILIDTSVFIEYARTNAGLLEEVLLTAQRERCKLYTSCLTLYEFWRGSSMQRAEIREKAEILFRDIVVLPCTAEIAKHAGTLDRERYDGVDSIIAATAVIHDLRLATLNSKDFSIYEEIELFTA